MLSAFRKERHTKNTNLDAKLTVTHKEGLVLGAYACHGTPYDGHTLKKAIEDASSHSGKSLEVAYVDKGYRGHRVEGFKVFMSGQKKGVTRWFKKRVKRRQAIEPQIGHMKKEGKLGRNYRNYLRGKIGDQINIVLCGIGHNLRMIARNLRATALLT